MLNKVADVVRNLENYWETATKDSQTFTEEDWVVSWVLSPWDSTISASNLSPFIAVNGLHLPGKINSDYEEQWFGEMHFFVVIDVLIKPVLSALQRPCVEIQTIHHDKDPESYCLLSLHTKSFQCSSSCFYLFLVWHCFFERLVWDSPLNFLQGNKSCRAELLQNSCNRELEIFNQVPTWNFKLKAWNEANVPVTFYEPLRIIQSLKKNAWHQWHQQTWKNPQVPGGELTWGRAVCPRGDKETEQWKREEPCWWKQKWRSLAPFLFLCICL